MSRGRPSSFKEEYKQILITLAKLGATDEQMAEALQVTRPTIDNWRKRFPEFFYTIKEAKNEADEKVEASLYRLAIGYEYEAEKPMVVATGKGNSQVVTAKYKEIVQPNTTAMIFWLKNRQPAKWRDKQEHEHSGEIGVTIIDDIK